MDDLDVDIQLPGECVTVEEDEEEEAMTSAEVCIR